MWLMLHPEQGYDDVRVARGHDDLQSVVRGVNRLGHVGHGDQRCIERISQWGTVDDPRVRRFWHRATKYDSGHLCDQLSERGASVPRT
jgi:hypothetical protein